MVFIEDGLSPAEVKVVHSLLNPWHRSKVIEIRSGNGVFCGDGVHPFQSVDLFMSRSLRLFGASRRFGLFPSVHGSRPDKDPLPARPFVLLRENEGNDPSEASRPLFQY